MMAYSRDSGEDRSIDLIGALLITAGLVLILVVLGQGEVAKDGWKTPYIIALLILGVVLIGAFLRWQHHLEQQQNARRSAHLSIEPSNPILATSDSTPNKAENIRVPDEAQPHPPWKVNMRILSYSPPPLMKLSLWTRADGRLAAAMGIAFLGWCAFLGWTFWTQLYYQRYAGYPPVETVKRLLPMFVCGILCNLFVGFFVGRVPIVYLLVIGTLSTSTACLLFALIIPSASYWAFGFPAASLSVVGADFIFSSGTLFIAKVSRDDEQSLAGALFQTMTQLGTATGMAISTVVFNRVMKKQTQLHGPGEDAIMLAQLNSYKAAQWTCFGFGILATLLAIVFFRSVGIVGTVKKGAKQEDSESQKSGRSPDVTFVNEEK
ncbi:hypothetical protein AX16_005461 [Volvariella volvacea WC 439]|nr:hypothetical protein AX16_005461 [Volvariella volvacea WC 439]